MIKNKRYDVMIVGGGAAGITAAISARRKYPDYSIALLDRTFAFGRKLLVTGGGRCNITNRNVHSSQRGQYFHGASEKFITSIFDQFDYEDISLFFNDLGVEMVEEQKAATGKIFPLTNQSKTVTALLVDELERNNIDLFLNCEVTSIQFRDCRFFAEATILNHDHQAEQKKKIQALYVILAAGSKTYPALGSNGSGYDLAQSFLHTLIQPIPSGLPLEGKNRLTQALQGIKIRGEITSLIEGKSIKTVTDDLLFTKYGLSGMAILILSRDISISMNRYKKEDCQVVINFLPGFTKEGALKLLQSRWKARPDRLVEVSLFGLVPNKVASALLESARINRHKKVQHITPEEEERICVALTGTKIQIQGTRGWNEAEFTAGGINTNEIKAATLESKKQKNLYFCGEIVDVDGDIGGYNLSWCWSSGWVAGQLL